MATQGTMGLPSAREERCPPEPKAEGSNPPSRAAEVPETTEESIPPSGGEGSQASVSPQRAPNERPAASAAALPHPGPIGAASAAVPDSEFARTLRYYRKQAGKSMGDVARHLGVSRPYVSEVERGSRGPFTQERIRSVSRLLGISAHILLDAAAEVDGYWRLPVMGVPEQDRLASFFATTWRALPLHQVREILAVIECQCDGCQSTPPGPCYSESRAEVRP